MENKPKRTAVDYLFTRMEVLRGLFLFEEIDYKEYIDEKKDAFEQAKQMEKQQIINSYRVGFISEDIKLADDYYNEEYVQTPNN